jgi:hypothetical protein
MTRPANQVKQGKEGRDYGGFYATDKVADAAGYAGNDGAIYDVRIKPGTKIAEKSGEITRLSKAVRDQYIADGYGVVVGKDVRGRTEYNILDKNAIEDVVFRAEPANVTTPTEAQPEAVGDGTVGGTQGVGDSGRAEDITQATTGAEAPAGDGLGGDMSVPMGAAVSESDQPAALDTSEITPKRMKDRAAALEEARRTGEARAVKGTYKLFADPQTVIHDIALPDGQIMQIAYQNIGPEFTTWVDLATGAYLEDRKANVLASLTAKFKSAARAAKAATEARTPARQLIPGTRTPVDPSTLQPTGKPRMERSEVYAPTEQAPAKVSRDIQEQAALADLVKAYVARTTPEYRNQTGTGGGINSKTKFAEVPEWTTLEDKLVVLGLLESTPTSPQERAAKLYFSKTVRPSDALDMMIDDLTAA